MHRLGTKYRLRPRFRWSAANLPVFSPSVPSVPPCSPKHHVRTKFFSQLCIYQPHHLSKKTPTPISCSMPRMSETGAIRIFQVTSTIGACRGSPRRIPAAPAQAIRDAEDDGSYPRMPNDNVLRGLLKSGLQRHLGHDMRSLKAWIRANRCPSPTLAPAPPTHASSHLSPPPHTPHLRPHEVSFCVQGRGVGRPCLGRRRWS